MSREFQPIIRVEGKKFALPSPATPEIRSVNSAHSEENNILTGISAAAMHAAVVSAEASYPTRSQEIAKQALETAMPILREASKKTGSLHVVSISDEAVEAVAEAIYSLCGKESWDNIGYRLRWIFREDARSMLEAAAPHIQFHSVFWDDLAEDLKDPEYAAEYAKITAEIQKEQE